MASRLKIPTGMQIIQALEGVSLSRFGPRDHGGHERVMKRKNGWFTELRNRLRNALGDGWKFGLLDLSLFVLLRKRGDAGYQKQLQGEQVRHERRMRQVPEIPKKNDASRAGASAL